MKKVMIIDDDEAILDAISIVLESEGYSVRTIREADDAVSEMLEYKPDIIFLDLLLSGKEGTEIAEEINNIDELCDTPVILISAHPDASISANDCGANEFLAKPFDLSELLGLVRRYS